MAYRGKHSSGIGGKGLLLGIIAAVLFAAVLLLILLPGRGGVPHNAADDPEWEGQTAPEHSTPAEPEGADDAPEPAQQEQNTDVSEPDAPEYSAGHTEPSGPTPDYSGVAELSVPYLLADGLELLSISTATVPNPDAGWEMSDETAGIELCNNTGQHITHAEISVTCADGTVFDFVVCDLPAGMTAQVFDTSNTRFDSAVPCVAAACGTLETAEGDRMLSTVVSVSVSGTSVTLTNISGQDTGPLTLSCVNGLFGRVFGGAAYEYPVGSIPAGGSVTVVAADCILGETLPVSIVRD